MKRTHFPDPRRDDLDDIVAVGIELSTETLIDAYSHGIFPWPHEGLPLLWCSPRQRGILEFEKIHLPRSFQKFLKQTSFQIRFNHDFAAVIQACAEVKRPGQKGTWIFEPLQKAYIDFHKAGHAHSVEVWDGNEMVGGLYGVFVAGVFSGESMFFKRANASKLALYATIKHLQDHGVQWMDIQMLTPVTEQFGGRYLSRMQYLDLLQESQKNYSDLGVEGSTNHILFPQGAPFSAL